MKKNALNLIIFIIVLLLILGLGYKLNQFEVKKNPKNELVITIEGGGRVVRNDLDKIIIYRDQSNELEYLKIKYSNNEEDLFNFDRIIGLNYGLKIKEKIEFKPLAKLELETKNSLNEL
ncbi:MAG: hypothetical protein AWU54_216 [Candidatus Frackibacter sp. T328-2]|nr:MAG: hypothetical protein AWU54_216 [Candidatus Frackibacter sp. T328-2]